MEPLHFTENARTVLAARYLRRNRSGDIVENPEELFQRVAAAVSEPELHYAAAAEARQYRDVFFQMMARKFFLPNSPTLMNAGTAMNQLSACFVLPVGDSIADIFDAVKHMAMVQQSGGGTGFSFSQLRPQGEYISTTGGRSSGPISFMQIFACATDHIKQGGKRRGANMAVLQADHPDIIAFIRAKRGNAAFENFNLSVLVDDTFMKAVRDNKRYALRRPKDGGTIAHMKAAEIFDELCQAAWETGDPGLIFADAANADNPTPHLGSIAATNPCGEIPLLDYESCNLGSINLAQMLTPDRRRINRRLLEQTVADAVHFLDNVIDVSRYPIRAIEKMTRGNRKIGLGVMGFSDMLIKMGIAYDSQEAVSVADQVMEIISGEALRTSRRLAHERGIYPNWKGSVHQKSGQRLRNATRTAVAPTGSISIIAGVNPGIEPLFALSYRRSNVLDGRTLYEFSPLLDDLAQDFKIDADRVTKRIKDNADPAGLADIPPKMRRILKTALEIPPEQHLRIQHAFQRRVDNAVSKTVNLPQNAVPADIRQIYQRAWELGLKGITVYRYGSKTSQVFETDEGRTGGDIAPASCKECP